MFGIRQVWFFGTALTIFFQFMLISWVFKDLVAVLCLAGVIVVVWIFGDLRASVICNKSHKK